MSAPCAERVCLSSIRSFLIRDLEKEILALLWFVDWNTPPHTRVRRCTMDPATSPEASENPTKDISPELQATPSSATPDVSHLFRVYKPPEAGDTTSLNDLTDSDFEPTSAELQAAYAGQKHRLEALVNAPLKTQAIKEREQKAKINRWPKVRATLF